MKTPRFWSSKNILSTLLLPAAGLYYLASRWRQAHTTPAVLSVPVICIGNLTTGGAGKTPVALAIGEMLKAKHINAFYVSRGYGGSARGPLMVEPHTHSAALVGDEPLLLAGVLPTVVGKNRLAAAEFAIAQGAEMIVMDDGFQNPTLAKTLSFIVVDRRLSFGNERLLPAGPLREPVKRGLSRAQALIIVNPANFLPTALPAIPIIIARSHPHADALALSGKKILAFCGIAYPKKFYDMLRNAGADIVEKISFADHHRYSEKDIKRLREQAKAQNLQLVTTAKDAARLPDGFKSEIHVAHMVLTFENSDIIDELIESARHAKKN